MQHCATVFNGRLKPLLMSKLDFICQICALPILIKALKASFLRNCFKYRIVYKYNDTVLALSKYSAVGYRLCIFSENVYHYSLNLIKINESKPTSYIVHISIQIIVYSLIPRSLKILILLVFGIRSDWNNSYQNAKNELTTWNITHRLVNFKGEHCFHTFGRSQASCFCLLLIFILS